MSFNDPECACEIVSNSPHGVVENAETIYRVIISPIHIDEKTREVKPAAFQIVDLRDRGLSVLRPKFLGEGELEEQGRLLCGGNPDRSVEMVLTGSVEAVRALRDLQQRKAFCVIDDAQPGQDMHATVMRSADQPDHELKALRRQLMEIFADAV